MSARIIDRPYRAGLWLAYRVLLVGWFVFRPTRRGVFIGVWHRGRVLVIRTSYRDCYPIVAGGISRHETAAEAAARELREEVGIDVDPGDLELFAEILSCFEHKLDYCLFFEVELEDEPRIRVDGREVVWAELVPAARALDMYLAPPVREYLERRLRSEAAPRRDGTSG